MEKPLVSIILPTYNGNTKWLTESINSVLNQSYINFELIVINDASTNDIEKTILNFIKKDSRIKYYKNDTNLHLTNSLNKGIEYSIGKYIARIDDDDIWCDINKLKKQIEFMEYNPKYGLCGTSINLIDELGNIYEKIKYKVNDNEIRNYISGSSQFAHSSVVIRKDILIKAGGYKDESYNKYCEDYDLWLRIGLLSNFHNLEDFCINYRVRKGSISGKKSINQLINSFRVYIKYSRYYPNKIRGIITHIFLIFSPNIIAKFMVKINNLYIK